MTLEDLLLMRSGLDWDEGMPIYQEMMATRDWVKFVLDKPMVKDRAPSSIIAPDVHTYCLPLSSKPQE